jgi:hypothetical protein
LIFLIAKFCQSRVWRIVLWSYYTQKLKTIPDISQSKVVFSAGVGVCFMVIAMLPTALFNNSHTYTRFRRALCLSIALSSNFSHVSELLAGLVLVGMSAETSVSVCVKPNPQIINIVL